MSLEQNNDLASWWNEQSFVGKELFDLDEAGTLTLRPGSNIKERVIANIAPENCQLVLKNLIDKFAGLEIKVREIETEWVATEDKQKLAEKVAFIKDYSIKINALGDFAKLGALIHSWEHALYQLAEENYNAKLKLAELAESMAESTNWKETTQAFRDLSDKWKQAGHVDKSRNDKLFNRIEAARKAFHDKKRNHQDNEEKDMLLNLDLKIELVEQAEAIAASKDWKKTTEEFHRLTDEWKTIGHTMNKKNEELWQRFLAAKSTFFDKKREHSNMVQQEQEANMLIKQVIIDRAEALKDSTDWNATTQAYATLMEEWKKTGRVPQAKADELWKRFIDAQEQFFEAKRAHTDGIRSVHENNYNLKKAIYERAEQLKHSNHWSETTAIMSELLEEWKKIGPIPRSYGDKMWEDFNAARKFFFNRKDASREERKKYAENQKVARMDQARDLVKKLNEDIKEEIEKIADFKEGLGNITPGKKAEQLKAHLTKLIEDGERNIKRWQEKLVQANEDLKLVEQKEKDEAAAAAGASEEAK